jgi:hypothetical protein
MDGWTQVARRYDRLRPRQGFDEEWDASLLNSRLEWLREHVLPLVARALSNPTFREHATWSLKSVCPGSEEVARKQVERLARRWRTTAEKLVALESVAELEQGIRAMPRQSIAVEQTVMISADKPSRILSRSMADVDCFGLVCQALKERAAAKPPEWFSPRDYLRMEVQFRDVPDSSAPEGRRRLANGNTLTSLWSRLEPLGDLIARSGRQRIEADLQVLREVHNTFRSLPEWSQLAEHEQVSELQQAWANLNSAWDELRAEMFEAPLTRLRDSCATLVQLAVSFGTDLDVSWLPVPAEVLEGGAKRLEHDLSGRQGPNLWDRIPAALRDVGDAVGFQEPVVDPVTAAIEAGGLVLVPKSKSVYWEKKPIALGNGTKNWEFLSHLATNAKRRRPVTECDLFPDETPSPSSMPNRWARLREWLPESLAERIAPAEGIARSYRLQLEASRIYIHR